MASEAASTFYKRFLERTHVCLLRKGLAPVQPTIAPLGIGTMWPDIGLDCGCGKPMVDAWFATPRYDRERFSREWSMSVSRPDCFPGNHTDGQKHGRFLKW